MTEIQKEKYVIYDDSIKYMLKNIDEMVNIIYNDFERNGGVHPNYILEKLLRAENDLKVLIQIANIKREENMKEGNADEYI